ncbi:MAG: glycerol-3-phosphate 1-O-acyltransferase PlsY [Candidatus Sumerlaeia bacterium]|nr:glycerol-3-phosphate 1-O-acyltransferase PlsY [Candidatus Sumerlaeia bacterium]
MDLLLELLLLFLAYLLGAVPTGLVLGKAVKGIDVRKEGSGNIGTTNVWRVLGWKLGVTTLLLDVGKALVAVVIFPAIAMGVLPAFAVLVGAAVLLGNFFNIFLGGRGGKGAATSLGVFLGLAPVPMVITFAVFGVVIGTTRIVSLGSITGAVLLPILVALLHGVGALFVMTLIISTLVIVKHRANIKRLMAGTEPRFGKGKKT